MAQLNALRWDPNGDGGASRADEYAAAFPYHPTAKTTATIKGLTPGTTCQLQVSAKNAEGSSPWSRWG